MQGEYQKKFEAIHDRLGGTIDKLKEKITQIDLQTQAAEGSSLAVEEHQALIKEGYALLKQVDQEASDISEKRSVLKDYFDAAIFIPAHMCKYVVLQEDNRPIDPYLEKMINDIKAKGVNQPEVLDAFKVVDRKYFMNFAEPNEDSEIN